MFAFAIEDLTLQNTYYRKVLYTNPGFQLVVMSLRPLEEIGKETHPRTTQFIRVEKGRATAIVGKKVYRLKAGDSVVVPPKTPHNIINKSKMRDLKLYTIYTPAEHKPKTIQKRKPVYDVV